MSTVNHEIPIGFTTPAPSLHRTFPQHVIAPSDTFLQNSSPQISHWVMKDFVILTPLLKAEIHILAIDHSKALEMTALYDRK
uniref:AraC family transcriptional regulator n=1 Tax=Steinernema glaseri TaxID=37863 RepID=A0A1I7Z6F3_9BILA